jgi:hypothetical protein
MGQRRERKRGLRDLELGDGFEGSGLEGARRG